MAAFEKDNIEDAKDKCVEIETMEKMPDILTLTSLNDAERGTVIAPDRKAESKLVRRIDILILPLLALSIMVGYLDRSNIGNARVLGMEEDLNLSDQQFLNVIMMFCTSTPSIICKTLMEIDLGYMLLELPAALSLRYIHPRYVFSGALICFGVLSACLSVANGYAGLMILRVLIGLGEVFIQCGFIYISLWYRPSELSLRAGRYSLTQQLGRPLLKLGRSDIFDDSSRWCSIGPDSIRLWYYFGRRLRNAVLEMAFRKSGWRMLPPQPLTSTTDHRRMYHDWYWAGSFCITTWSS